MPVYVKLASLLCCLHSPLPRAGYVCQKRLMREIVAKEALAVSPASFTTGKAFFKPPSAAFFMQSTIAALLSYILTNYEKGFILYLVFCTRKCLYLTSLNGGG